MNFMSFIASLPNISERETKINGDTQWFRLYYDNTYIEVATYPLDPSKPCLVRSAPVSITQGAAKKLTELHAFMTFNLSAASACNTSWASTVDEPNSLRLIWNPTVGEQSKSDWQKQIRNFCLVWKKHIEETSAQATAQVPYYAQLRP